MQKKTQGCRKFEEYGKEEHLRRVARYILNAMYVSMSSRDMYKE